MDIEHSLSVLRSGAVNLRRRQQELGEKSKDLAARLAQAKSNAESLGSNSPAVVVLVLITILTPYFGFIVGQINTPKTNYDYSGGKKNSGYDSGGTYSAPASKSNVGGTAVNTVDLPIPAPDITDAEIQKMPASQQEQYANNLFWQATDLTYSSAPDYAKAEQKMRLALRLGKNEKHYFNLLGYILLKAGNYEESLKFLNQSLKIDKSNIDTKVYIGINYLESQRFKDAQAVLSEAVSQFPGSFEGFYNLGLANKGIVNHPAAVEAFQKAIKIKPNDADANYELGLAYRRSGDEIGVQQQYEKLLDINPSKAEQLAKATNLVRTGMATRTH